MTYPEAFYKIALICFGTLVIIFFGVLFLIILKEHIETKNEIKEEKKEFDKKLNFIKNGMSEEKITELEGIIDCLTIKDKKEFVNKVYKEKFEENLKKYEKSVDVKE